MTISGIVYDYFTNLPVSGVDILVFGVTTTGLVQSGISNSVGEFSFSTFSGVGAGEEIVYYPRLSGYVGYTKQIYEYIDDVNLYVREKTYTSQADFINLTNSFLHGSTVVADLEVSPCYYFITTSGGLDIVDLNSNLNVAYASLSGGFTCVGLDENVCSSQEILLGTNGDGVYSYTLPDTEFLSQNITSEVLPFYTAASGDLTSNVIDCIDLDFETSRNLVGTESGVDYHSGATRYFSSYGSAVNTTACKLTSSGDVYYSPTDSGIYAKYGLINADWGSPDYSLDSTTTPALSGNLVNDIDVTQVSGLNYVYLATNSGVFIYEEDRNDIATSTTKTYGLSVISGSSLNITGIKASTNSTLTSGKILISTYDTSTTDGVIQEIDLSTDTVINTFSTAFFESNLRRAGLSISGSRFLDGKFF